jgi:uncharacterized membrane protein HdeD (DUF308 family)
MLLEVIEGGCMPQTNTVTQDSPQQSTASRDAEILEVKEALRFGRNWWIVALRGFLSLLVGVISFVVPMSTIFALVILFAAYALLDGIFCLAALVRGSRSRGPWWMLTLEGVLGIGAAVITVLWPEITALALIYVIASWAIVTGGIEIIAAVRLRKHIESEWLLAAAGVSSIVMGVVLALWPGPGAVGIAWIIGAYAMVFGVLLIALAFRLRRWHVAQAPMRQVAGAYRSGKESAETIG